MTRRSSSIRTAWPGPPRHRHRRATSARWSTARRVVLGLVALLAGILALNGVIQATASPSRTASSGHDVDIASLLPPPAAAEVPAVGAAAPTAQVAVGKVADQDGPSSGARSPEDRSPEDRSGEVRPPVNPGPAGKARVTPGAAVGGPAAARLVEGAAGAPARDRTPTTDEARSVAGDGPVNRPDDDSGSVDERARVIATPTPTPSPTSRPGRTGLLPAVRCAVDGVKIAGRSPLGSC